MIASVSARPRNIRPMQVAAQLGLAGDALDRLADQVTHADARPDRAEAGAEAERDGLRGIVRRYRQAPWSSDPPWKVAVGSVGRLDREADVDAREHREDERLQLGHEAHSKR